MKDLEIRLRFSGKIKVLLSSTVPEKRLFIIKEIFVHVDKQKVSVQINHLILTQP